MKSDGQLYDVRHKGELPLVPPSLDESECECESLPKKKKRLKINEEELLILGLIFLLLSDKCETDIPLILALAYVLFSK